MNADLQKLIEAAQAITMTNDDQEEQRQSFAYGNSKIENDAITRELVAKQAEALKFEREK